MMPAPRLSQRLLGHDEIAAILGSEILSGALAPGGRVPSLAELFKRFGVSRVLVREVMKTLAAKGLIASKSRVGTHVLAPEHWSWFDPDLLAWRVRLGFDATFVGQLAEMRRAVEPAAASLAAARRTLAHVGEMHTALAAMERAGADRRAFAEADLAFHIAVATASGNPLFRAFTGVVETALGAYFTVSTPARSTALTANIRRHAAIADAIEARDGDAAARAMISVIDEGLERVTRKRL